MLNYSQLSQYRTPSTAIVSIFSPGANETVQVFLKITNTSSGEALVRIFHDDNGTTYDESTAIAWDIPLQQGEILEMEHIFMSSETGNLAYMSSVGNALTATVYGILRND